MQAESVVAIMAFLVKQTHQGRTSGPAGTGQATLNQMVHVSRPALALPQSTTEQLFRVKGGRVWVHLLLGEVTTVIQNSDPVAKISSKKLDATSTAVGSAVDIAPTVALTSLEVGGLIFMEGDNTALLLTNAGGGGVANNNYRMIIPQGEIYLTTGASKTGAIKWDIWYQPLDEGAFVEAVSVATAAI